MDDEFLNLYLNDLIIKVSFENNYDNYELFQSIKQNMKEMKIKIKDNKNLDEIIKTIDTQEQYYFKEILINKSYIFYEYLNKLIPNLQFSIMSLLTLQQINIFNFDMQILYFLSNRDLYEQERAVKIIDSMNTQKNYTHMNIDYETFIKHYSLFDNINFEYSNNNTKSITITPSKIIYNIPINATTNHFQRKLINYNDNIIKISVVDEDNENFTYFDLSKSQRLISFIKTIFKKGISLGFCKYNYIGSSNSQFRNLGGWMINLEGIRKLQEIDNNIIKYFISPSKKY